MRDYPVTQESFPVKIGAEGGVNIEPSRASFVTDRPFSLEITNRSGPVHVHCKFDKELGAVASVSQSNFFVPADDETFIPIDVHPQNEPVSGYLTLSTKYGAETVRIELTVEPIDEERTVDVDDRLSKPPQREEPPQSILGGFERPDIDDPHFESDVIVVSIIAVIALAIALAAAYVVGGVVAGIGFLVVTIGILIAIGLLYYNP